MILLSYYDTGCCLHPIREFKTVSSFIHFRITTVMLGKMIKALQIKLYIVVQLRRELGCHQRKQASSHRLPPRPETYPNC